MDRKELKIFIAMSRTLNSLNRKSNEVFRKYGLTTGQFAVLEVLYHKGDLTVGEIQEFILSTTGNMPVIIKNLRNQKLIRTYKAVCDKRRTMVALTKKGNNLISKVFPENKTIIEDYFSILEDQEKETLLNLLSKYKKG